MPDAHRGREVVVPASALANATHWEEGAMTNPDIPHPAMRGFAFGLGLADNSGGAKTLKPKCVLVAITFLALMSVTRAFAAPRGNRRILF